MINFRKAEPIILLLILGAIITIITLTGCGTSNKVYNIGTGELIEKR
tara:strand:- start:1576 stop:1716 length:141 start_codon:yes stop_codon:yes gene_type:complete